MKVLDVDSFRNGDHTTLKHGSVYEETMLGNSSRNFHRQR